VSIDTTITEVTAKSEIGVRIYASDNEACNIVAEEYIA
jgi:hypothetical protein